jgi:hypothetical protein
LLACKTIKSEFGLWKGNLQETIDILGDTQDIATFRISPMWACIISNLIIRPYALRGDIEAADNVISLLKFFLENLPKIPATRGYVIHLHFCELWMSIVKQDYRFAVESYNNLTTAYKDVHPSGTIPTEFAAWIPFLTWMLVSVSERYQEFRNVHGRGDVQLLCKEIRESAGIMYQKSLKMKNARIASWGVDVFKACLDCMDGNFVTEEGKEKGKKSVFSAFMTKNKGKVSDIDIILADGIPKGLIALANRVQSPAGQEELIKFPLMKGLVYAVLGKYGVEVDRFKYRDKAIQVLHEMGAKEIVRWIQQRK